MKHARILYAGAIHNASGEGDILRLDDGRQIAVDEAVWLPPFEIGTAFALGLNYADHAAELNFKAPDKPLVFLKSPNTFLGHNGRTRRPRDVTFMHYECELAVVIGRTARNVSSRGAYDYVRGYTVANDYAIRDYLENYFRPNLRVKNRDGCTPIGPYLVDREDVPDPMSLPLRTLINGKVVQSGNTADMVFDIPYLIEYLSKIMTLSPGDVILTGTPKGSVDVRPGDVVVTEIDGIGRLVNTIAEDWTAADTT